MEGKKGSGGKWGFRAGECYKPHPINFEGRRAGVLCRAWLGRPERVLFPWKSELQGQPGQYVGPGKEIWKTCILEEPGFPGEHYLTLKGGINTAAGPGSKLEELYWLG